jgi:hypothetical protein
LARRLKRDRFLTLPATDCQSVRLVTWQAAKPDTQPKMAKKTIYISKCFGLPLWASPSPLANTSRKRRGPLARGREALPVTYVL